MASDDSKDDSQYEFAVSLKDNQQSLCINVRDKKNLRKFTNTYTSTSLTAKGLTQSVDKLQKLLKTAAKNNKDNWTMLYGYYTNPNMKHSSSTSAAAHLRKSDQIDLMPTYLSKSDIKSLRKKPKSNDTLFIVLKINEDFFSVDTQFKLYEIEKPKKAKSRRTLSNAPQKASSPFGDYADSQQKISNLEAKIKSLTRDNQVLKAKLSKLEATSGKKQKKMDSEREMRLQANKERFWLKQKLERLQKAIAARLKILGVDFSKVDDITSALDMAFNVIQKLAAELQKKEEGFEDMKEKMGKATKEAASLRKGADKLNATIEKQKGVMQDLRKQLNDRDRRLSIVAHEKNDTESMLQKQLEDLKNEAEALRKDKEELNNALIDEKAKLKGELDDKEKELDDLKDKLNKAKEDNEKLIAENESLKEDNEKLLNSKSDLDAKLQEALKEIEDLKNEIESEKDKNNNLSERNKELMDKIKRLKQEIKKLIGDLARLKQLLEKACNLELQLKNVLDDSHELVTEMTENDKTELIKDDDE